MVTMKEAVKKIAPLLKEYIDKAEYDVVFGFKEIIVALARESGDLRFLDISDKDLYWSIRLPLYNEGIVVLGGVKTKTGENAIRMRKLRPGDTPPEEFPEWDIPEIGLLIRDHSLLNVSIGDIEDALARNQEIIYNMESIFETN